MVPDFLTLIYPSYWSRKGVVSRYGITEEFPDLSETSSTWSRERRVLRSQLFFLLPCCTVSLTGNLPSVEELTLSKDGKTTNSLSITSANPEMKPNSECYSKDKSLQISYLSFDVKWPKNVGTQLRLPFL